jgi:hypothetical protein
LRLCNQMCRPFISSSAWAFHIAIKSHWLSRLIFAFVRNHITTNAIIKIKINLLQFYEPRKLFC